MAANGSRSNGTEQGGTSIVKIYFNEQTCWQDFVDADEAEQDAQGEALFAEWREEQESERLARLRKRLGREANEAERDADKAEEDARDEALFVEWREEQESERLARLRKRFGREANKAERDTDKAEEDALFAERREEQKSEQWARF